VKAAAGCPEFTPRALQHSEVSILGLKLIL
jgi:hypothetical protein